MAGNDGGLRCSPGSDTHWRVTAWRSFWPATPASSRRTPSARQSWPTHIVTGGWIKIWLAAACVSLLISVGTMWLKARAAKTQVMSRPGRKLLLNFAPPAVVGALLTPALVRVGAWELIPAVWLLLYGAGIRSGGQINACDNLDIASTLLTLLDVPVPPELTGRVLLDECAA